MLFLKNKSQEQIFSFLEEKHTVLQTKNASVLKVMWEQDICMIFFLY